VRRKDGRYPRVSEVQRFEQPTAFGAVLTVFKQFLPLILVWFLASASQAFPQDYLDPTVCRPCHQRLYDEYLATPMGSSFYSMGAKADQESTRKILKEMGIAVSE